ncbi:KipI family sensor histidine kinase inhibitor [Paenarthrobacter nicotinovorans]|uniref:5-oxoprolinase subunit B/C family protein n=1 Tax=Paenarthrobacter nicotinovorans TaxID=29320 RepID=UPI00278A8CDC|nr:5-oxoprolinase/urea amidolyase family protein [Paenarthrobacter nicotinovorans]MDP9936791.1 KipI family sensor histidine kinase inhibitor [Paenarthrobacter nicotinovorans]
MKSVRTVGERGVLAELANPDDVLALTEMLNREPCAGQREVVPAAETVLITAESPAAAERIKTALATRTIPPYQHSAGKLVEIDTIYDGQDLAVVAELAGISPEAVVAAHTGQLWTVAFTGFVPGFGYMVGENGVLNVPRRATPRTSVDAGSVALGGAYTGVYPRRSPGGWQIIGHTNCPMWDSNRPEPALVSPGTSVRYKAVRELVEVRQPDPGRLAASTRNSGLEVQRSVPLTLVQDLGRPGYAAIGVSRSGALDQGSLRRANRLVGNPEDATALEVVDGGLSVRAVGDQIVALTGAPAGIRISSAAGTRTVKVATAFALLDGETLTLSPPSRGVRSYLAIRGAFEAEQVLGSSSADTMAALGPSPLAVGDFLSVGADPGTAVGLPETQPDFPDDTAVELKIGPGPRADWFSPGALRSLLSQEWTVTNESNRIGMRLSGEPLERIRDDELPSEGTICGVIQVPPTGQPVVFLSDHPVTGGYPVIAVVAPKDLDKAAQIPAGGKVRFTPSPSMTESTS